MLLGQGLHPGPDWGPCLPHPRHLHPLQFALFCAHLCAPGSRTDVHMVRRRTAWLGGYCGCPIPPGPRAGQPLNPGCWKSHKTPADRWLAGGPVTGPASVKLPTGRWASELGFSVGSVCLRRPSAPGQPRPGSLGLQLAQDAGSLVPTSPNPLIVSGKQGKGQEKQTVHHSGSCVLTGKGDRSGPVVQHPQSPAVRWLWLSATAGRFRPKMGSSHRRRSTEQKVRNDEAGGWTGLPLRTTPRVACPVSPSPDEGPGLSGDALPGLLTTTPSMAQVGERANVSLQHTTCCGACLPCSRRLRQARVHADAPAVSLTCMATRLAILSVMEPHGPGTRNHVG